MMERYSFQKIESKWRSNIKANSVKNKDSKKNIIVWKCFLILQAKFIWAMFEIIQ